MILQINRNAWTQGAFKTIDASGTVRRCAIGAYLSACGMPDDALGTPLMWNAPPAEASWLVAAREGAFTIIDAVAAEIISTNDSCAPANEIEQRIVELFGKRGIDAEWVNGPIETVPMVEWNGRMVPASHVERLERDRQKMLEFQATLAKGPHSFVEHIMASGLPKNAPMIDAPTIDLSALFDADQPIDFQADEMLPAWKLTDAPKAG